MHRLKNAIYWLSFINLPRLMSNLFDAQQRMYIQPSVVLSALALSTLMKSSETGLGAEGRKFAEWLRDAAQSSLEASLNASWIEPSLANAAFVSRMFFIRYLLTKHSSCYCLKPVHIQIIRRLALHRPFFYSTRSSKACL